MKNTKDLTTLYKSLKENEETKRPIQSEPWVTSLLFARDENKVLLDEYNIKLTPDTWIVLSIEPEVLKKTILRAKDLGFLEAYIQNPCYLKYDVDAVIKRISEFEHLNIPYKNEKGKYQTYLFSKRAYDYVISSINKKNDTKGIMDVELKEYADRVIETFAMEDKKNEIYNKLSEIEKQGLGIKETLMEVFKVYSDNIDYLSANIDEILNSYKEGKGRVA